jgi:predicted small secreted protein
MLRLSILLNRTVTVQRVTRIYTINSIRSMHGINKYTCMKKLLTLSTVLIASFAFTGCNTVDASYQSAKGVGQSVVGGGGKIVGNGASDVSKTIGITSDTAGKVLSGGGKVVGGALELVGGVVKGTSEIVAPETPKP